MSVNNAYVHMSFKLSHPTDAIASLGEMSTEDIYRRFLHGSYPLADVKTATQMCAFEGLLDCVWVVDGMRFLEEDYAKFTTLKKIQNGDIFDLTTGQKYDSSTIEQYWVVPQRVLNQIGPEQNQPSTMMTRILKRLRFWQ